VAEALAKRKLARCGLCRPPSSVVGHVYSHSKASRQADAGHFLRALFRLQAQPRF
jgi:hypothetical protein